MEGEKSFRLNGQKVSVSPEKGWTPGKRWTVTIAEHGGPKKTLHDVQTGEVYDPSELTDSEYKSAALSGLERLEDEKREKERRLERLEEKKLENSRRVIRLSDRARAFKPERTLPDRALAWMKDNKIAFALAGFAFGWWLYRRMTVQAIRPVDTSAQGWWPETSAKSRFLQPMRAGFDWSDVSDPIAYPGNPRRFAQEALQGASSLPGMWQIGYHSEKDILQW